jgi:hypothetical protein
MLLLYLALVALALSAQNIFVKTYGSLHKRIWVLYGYRSHLVDLGRGSLDDFGQNGPRDDYCNRAWSREAGSQCRESLTALCHPQKGGHHIAVRGLVKHRGNGEREQATE